MLVVLDFLASVAFAVLIFSSFPRTPLIVSYVEKHPKLNPRSHDIPTELVVEIIHHLHHHDMTLRSCSLVCKTWIPLSRYHLFYRVNLNHSNVAAFVALLQSGSSSSIGVFVQQVRIWREVSHPPWMKEMLAILSAHLHPTSLELNIQNYVHRDQVPFEFGGSPVYDEDFSVFRDTFQETVRLSVTLDCDTFAEGIQVVCAFPFLEHLEVRGDWNMGREVHDPWDMPCLPSRVHSITCFQGGSPFFLWLLRQPHPSSVNKLSFRDTYITKTVRTYIKTLGESLQHLSFEPSFYQSTNPPDGIDISHSLGLRSINLYFETDVISRAFRLLSEIRSTDIEDVEIGLGEPAVASSPADLGPLELWSRLDTLLSSAQFSKLRHLKVAMPCCSPPIVRNLLPMCSARGIMGVLYR